MSREVNNNIDPEQPNIPNMQHIRIINPNTIHFASDEEKANCIQSLRQEAEDREDTHNKSVLVRKKSLESSMIRNIVWVLFYTGFLVSSAMTALAMLIIGISLRGTEHQSESIEIILTVAGAIFGGMSVTTILFSPCFFMAMYKNIKRKEFNLEFAKRQRCRTSLRYLNQILGYDSNVKPVRMRNADADTNIAIQMANKKAEGLFEKMEEEMLEKELEIQKQRAREEREFKQMQAFSNLQVVELPDLSQVPKSYFPSKTNYEVQLPVKYPLYEDALYNYDEVQPAKYPLYEDAIYNYDVITCAYHL